MEDGTFIGITDLLTFIAGPSDDSGSECFRYGGCSWYAPWNCVVEAANWIADRAKDVGNFIKNAVDKVGDWAKQASSAALNWAKNAGKSILEGLVKIGNAISCGVRKAFRAIASFFGDIFEKIKSAVNSAISYLSKATDKVWDVIKTPIGIGIDIVLEGTHCEYKVQRDISKLDAVKAIEPVLVPNLRFTVLQLVRGILNTVSGGILTPILAIVMPLVDPYILPHIDGLLAKALETNELTSAITTIADPLVDQISKISCKFLISPDINDINFNENIDDNSINSDTEWL